MNEQKKPGTHPRTAGANEARIEPPIPADIYPVIDTDLARDNAENDLPEADKEDL